MMSRKRKRRRTTECVTQCVRAVGVKLRVRFPSIPTFMPSQTMHPKHLQRNYSKRERASVPEGDIPTV